MEGNKYGSYEVVVVGGGIAGISAALAAARNGAKTLLVESSYFLGGLATSGLVTIYLPLCDGCGHQLSFGIAEELLKLSVSYGAEAEYPKAWLEEGSKEDRIRHRYRTEYNPQIFGILAEKELLRAGAEILYGATLTHAEVMQSYIKEITVSTRTETLTVEGSRFVDATGDATLCALAGEGTKTAKTGNILAAWYYELLDGRQSLKMNGSCDYIYSRGVQGKTYGGLESREISEYTVTSHDAVLKDFLQKGGISQSHALTGVATIPQFRMTRRLCGRTEILKSDNRKYREDSVGLFGSWLECGLAFELPFGALIGKTVRNLGAAGRCISSGTEEMWDITRVIPVCAVSGEAIGTAAAVGKDFHTVDIKKVQDALRRQNVKIHLEEIKEPT